MKANKYSEEQMVKILREADRLPVGEFARSVSIKRLENAVF
jgi:hypothetical protein